MFFYLYTIDSGHNWSDVLFAFLFFFLIGLYTIDFLAQIEYMCPAHPFLGLIYRKQMLPTWSIPDICYKTVRCKCWMSLSPSLPFSLSSPLSSIPSKTFTMFVWPVDPIIWFCSSKLLNSPINFFLFSFFSFATWWLGPSGIWVLMPLPILSPGAEVSLDLVSNPRRAEK